MQRVFVKIKVHKRAPKGPEKCIGEAHKKSHCQHLRNQLLFRVDKNLRS